MDRALWHRVLRTSLGSAAVTGGAVALVSSFVVDWLALFSLLLGTVFLGPAHLSRALAVLRCGPVPQRGTLARARAAVLAFLAVALTALAVALLSVGFGGADDDARTFGALLGAWALMRLWPSGELPWSAMSCEAVHRRLQSRILGVICWATAWCVACLLLTAWLEGAFSAVRARLLAGVLVLISAEAHAEATKGCTRMLAQGELPRSQDLVAALCQPLSAELWSAGLGRWLALTTLAQAVAHQQRRPLCHGAWSRPGVQMAKPPLAAEIFSARAVPTPAVAVPMPTAMASPSPPPPLPLGPVAGGRGGGELGSSMLLGGVTTAPLMAGPLFAGVPPFSATTMPTGSMLFGGPSAPQLSAGPVLQQAGTFGAPNGPFATKPQQGYSPVTVAGGSQGLVAAYLARGLLFCWSFLRAMPVYRQVMVDVKRHGQSAMGFISSTTGLSGWQQQAQPRYSLWRDGGGLQPPAGAAGATPWGTLGVTSAAAAASLSSPLGAAAPTTWGVGREVLDSLGMGSRCSETAVAAAARGLFAAYLTSGLEVLREFAARVECLAAAPSALQRAAGPSNTVAAAARRPVQLAAIESGVVELLALMQVASAGLTGWICLSRDLDNAGVVQREHALRRLIGELCGVLLALNELEPVRLSGMHELSQAGVAAARAAEAEARHALQQLVTCFERAGLQELQLPPQQQAIISDLIG